MEDDFLACKMGLAEIDNPIEKVPLPVLELMGSWKECGHSEGTLGTTGSGGSLLGSG